MLRQLAPFLLLFALSKVCAEPVPLLIGGTTIQFPVDAGYVRVSQAEPPCSWKWTQCDRRLAPRSRGAAAPIFGNLLTTRAPCP